MKRPRPTQTKRKLKRPRVRSEPEQTRLPSRPSATDGGWARYQGRSKCNNYLEGHLHRPGPGIPGRRRARCRNERGGDQFRRAFEEDAVERKPTPAGIRLQVLLDRAHFSPGEIDGKFGENAKKALRCLRRGPAIAELGRRPDRRLEGATADDRPVTPNYTITEKDVAGPFLAKLPSKMEDMKDIPKLSYTSPREGLPKSFT